MPTLETIINNQNKHQQADITLNNNSIISIVSKIIKLENNKLIEQIGEIKDLSRREINELKAEFIKPNYYCPHIVSYRFQEYKYLY
jgi:hypothetical protein